MARGHSRGEALGLGALVGEQDARDNVEHRSDGDAHERGQGVVPVVAGHDDGHEVSGTGDEEHVGNHIIVVDRDGAARDVTEGDSVGAPGEDLLVGACGDEGLEEA